MLFHLMATAAFLSAANLQSEQASVPCQIQDWRAAGIVKWSEPTKRAISIPFSMRWEQSPANRWWFDRGKDQWGQWWGAIDENGKVYLRLEFANGARVDGDHFAAILILRDSAGNALTDTQGRVASARFYAGINAKGFCHGTGKGHKCYKKTNTTEFMLDPEQLRMLAYVERRHGMYDMTDDQIFWGNVRALAACAELL